MLQNVMSQKIPYVTVWVTACSHYFGLSFPFFSFSFFTHTKKTHADSHSSRDLFSNIHRHDAQITYAWKHQHTHTCMHIHICLQSICHRVKLFTLLEIFRCLVCKDHQHHKSWHWFRCNEMDQLCQISNTAEIAQTTHGSLWHMLNTAFCQT